VWRTSDEIGLTWVDSVGIVRHRGPEDRRQRAEDRWRAQVSLISRKIRGSRHPETAPELPAYAGTSFTD